MGQALEAAGLHHLPALNVAPQGGKGWINRAVGSPYEKRGTIPAPARGPRRISFALNGGTAYASSLPFAASFAMTDARLVAPDMCSAPGTPK